MGPQEEAQERSYPERIEWNGELRYKPYHHSNKKPFSSSMIKNIGQKGLCFITPQDIPVGSILIIKLYQHQDYSPAKVLVKVAYCDPAPEHEGYAIDCHYHDLTPQEQAAVNEVVEEVCFIRRIHATVTNTIDGATLLEKGSSKNGHKKNNTSRRKKSRRQAKKTDRTA